ncbi:putative LRR receptor-like serine/threonine-protein kinase [Morus notabilis]|uniref:Putative LRR receptor-like serine/threonine-protein kinase n=1 Tax=Morus notabilis TaxID=981085 RepID=W9RZC8_9ROSA|nr:putative LRR receptor-like serine/threonine-protein kinase [Morus notabilis]
MKFSFLCSSKCFFSSSAINDEEAFRGVQILQNVNAFSYNELKSATNGFRSSNKIGEGGFGSVYKGRLQDGRIVAVKVLSADSKQGDKEFMTEIASLSNISHENLVKLHGGCVDGPFRILVYEYMKNNNLSRLMLDFGLSKLFPDNISHITTKVAGTLGYLSPEYAISGRLTRKSDVYSFGVLLLEIVSGRSAVDFDLQLGEHYLVEKAWEMYKSDKLIDLVDSNITNTIYSANFSSDLDGEEEKDHQDQEEDQEEEEEEEAVHFLKVGLLCVQENSRLRPTMSMAIRMMKNDIKIDDVQITGPGLINNIMDVKIGKRPTSMQVGTSCMQSPQSNNYHFR